MEVSAEASSDLIYNLNESILSEKYFLLLLSLQPLENVCNELPSLGDCKEPLKAPRIDQQVQSD